MRSVFRSILLFLPSVAILAAAQTYSTDVQNGVVDRERQLKQTVENENRDIVCNFNFGPLHLLAKTSKWTPKKVNKYISDKNLMSSLRSCDIALMAFIHFPKDGTPVPPGGVYAIYDLRTGELNGNPDSTDINRAYGK